MTFKVAEFVIEEFNGLDEKERERNESVIKEFADVDLRNDVRSILEKGGEHYYRYVINEVLSKPIYVGEITFSGNTEGEFEIGIGIEEQFRQQGIGYRLLVSVIDHLCRTRTVKAFTYKVMSNNEASKRLAEKLGGVLIKNVEPPKPLGFTFLIYKISPFIVDYSFLTKYISIFNEAGFNAWLQAGNLSYSDSVYGKPVVRFANDVYLFVDINADLNLNNYRDIFRANDVKDILSEIADMNELCLYAALVYCVRQERFCNGLLWSALKKGHITHILERLNSIHKIF